ncbi:YgaP family membrane protein [Nesterenkonia haasae]|uniref:YgaP family membrane protein n=1 Tax=Nesterenkonia haasae TaxID=2587813 RepID=UPI001391A116|nr:DUF2892 domain-containing protein [Nesterenkonia haasae]NDK31540.1 DUF2892 domain-containing protein [Nesterenkonia haasae]
MSDAQPTIDVTDPVRSSPSKSVQTDLDQETIDRIQRFSEGPASEISARIQQLEREWDIERILELNASSLAFLGTVLGVTFNKKWLLLPGTVLPFLFQHAVQGWCPPVALFRRLGVRTQKEIQLEKYTLKVLRGDFDFLEEKPDAESALRRVTR